MLGSARSLPGSTTGPAVAEKSICSSTCLYKLRIDDNIREEEGREIRNAMNETMQTN